MTILLRQKFRQKIKIKKNSLANLGNWRFKKLLKFAIHPCNKNYKIGKLAWLTLRQE